jgi:hypothetical protein
MPRLIVLAQVVVVCVMGALVVAGKDGAIENALLAVSGAIVGQGVLKAAAQKIKPTEE